MGPRCRQASWRVVGVGALRGACPSVEVARRAVGHSKDELGHVQLDFRGAELLFQIMTEREEKSSVAVASNLPFSEWGQVVADPRLVAAIADRFTFRTHVIGTGTESFGLKSTRHRNKR